MIPLSDFQTFLLFAHPAVLMFLGGVIGMVVLCLVSACAGLIRAYRLRVTQRDREALILCEARAAADRLGQQTMARPTDIERGARIAHERASAMLAAAEGKDLFPLRLTRVQRELWAGTHDAAGEQLAEERALKELRA